MSDQFSLDLSRTNAVILSLKFTNMDHWKEKKTVEQKKMESKAKVKVKVQTGFEPETFCPLLSVPTPRLSPSSS